MKVHGNAALGPAGRLALVQAIESGMTLRAAAAAPCHRFQPRLGGRGSRSASPRTSARSRQEHWSAMPASSSRTSREVGAFPTRCCAISYSSSTQVGDAGRPTKRSP